LMISSVEYPPSAILAGELVWRGSVLGAQGYGLLVKVRSRSLKTGLTISTRNLARA
jgi:hypothetical protein